MFSSGAGGGVAEPAAEVLPLSLPRPRPPVAGLLRAADLDLVLCVDMAEVTDAGLLIEKDTDGGGIELLAVPIENVGDCRLKLGLR